MRFAQLGASVTITGSSDTKAQRVLEKLKSLSPPSAKATFSASVFDASDFVALKKFTDTYIETHDKLHFLAISIGSFHSPKDAEPTVYNGQVTRMLAVNSVSRIALALLLAPLLSKTAETESNSGRVLFICNPSLASTSLGSFRDDLGLVKISKTSIKYVTGALGLGVLYQNIMVEKLSIKFPNVVFIHIHPGWVDTNFVEKVLPRFLNWILGIISKHYGATIDESGVRMVHYLTEFEVGKDRAFLIDQVDKKYEAKRVGNIEEENNIVWEWFLDLLDIK
ncbi:hypothetical protein HK096_000420 [Nowakowskiella sp. JEL0078]|nr:hypothetical protein HK096_000420 [Nowakowskiella sp. JEL0078]